jgi:hypothetical protein
VLRNIDAAWDTRGTRRIADLIRGTFERTLGPNRVASPSLAEVAAHHVAVGLNPAYRRHLSGEALMD